MTTLLEGKVALVTGAGHGVGRGHALELARQGAKVVVNDLGGSATGEGASRVADDVVTLIGSRDGEAVADYGDVSDEAHAEAMVQRAYDEWGRLDVVVNNAGIIRDNWIWDMPVEDLDQVLGVHVRGTWLVCRAAVRRWRERHERGDHVAGRIVNTTSGVGLGGNVRETNYAAAKAAVVGLTHALNLEVAEMGVTVNAIGPSGNTRIAAVLPGADFKIKEPDEYRAGEWSPTDPSNSSPLVAWLASDEAAHVSGQVFRVPMDRIVLMSGWYEAATIDSGEQRWNATELGRRIAEELFQTRHAGWPRAFNLRLG